MNVQLATGAGEVGRLRFSVHGLFKKLLVYSVLSGVDDPVIDNIFNKTQP